MKVQRGELWWAGLAAPRKSAPGYRRPVLVVQSDDFTRSKIATVIVATVTTNMALADAPGNVRVPRGDSKLGKESVVNVSQLITLDKAFLDERIGRLSPAHLARVEQGLRLVLALET